MSLNDYIKGPKKDWSDKEWLQHAYIMYHSPWINEEEKEYWKDQIFKRQRGKQPPDNRVQK